MLPWENDGKYNAVHAQGITDEKYKLSAPGALEQLTAMESDCPKGS